MKKKLAKTISFLEQAQELAENKIQKEFVDGVVSEFVTYINETLEDKKRLEGFEVHLKQAIAGATRLYTQSGCDDYVVRAGAYRSILQWLQGEVAS